MSTGAAAAAVEDRGEVRRWALYGWANHGWATTVSTVLIGPWLLALATAHRSGSATLFTVGPWTVRADAYPPLMISLAAVAQLLVLPAAGARADGAGSRRRWLTVACLAGSAVAASLAATSGSDWLAAGLLFITGTVIFGASDIVYNSFLPRIAPPHRRDFVSSLGFAYGYTGAGLLLAADLALIAAHHPLGISKATAVRACFVSAGLWWAGFGVWALRGVRERPRLPDGAPETVWPAGRRPRLRDAARFLRCLPETRRYLIAYLLFADGISSVIALSSTYLTHELFGDSAARAATFLFALILLIQFIAVAGSLLLARIARRLGAKRTVLLSLIAWTLIILYAYALLHTKAQAVGLGVAIGLVLGGSQALARSLYSQLIPLGLEATFFGLYEVANEGTAWIAPLLFTIVVDATGSYRQAILSLLTLFVAGGLMLARTRLPGTARPAPSARAKS
jgi:UMF1 family MFS transporter